MTHLFSENEQEALAVVVRQVLGGRPWRGTPGHPPHRRVRAPGRAELFAAVAGRGVVGHLCVVDDTGTERGTVREARRLGDRLTRLARVTTALVMAGHRRRRHQDRRLAGRGRGGGDAARRWPCGRARTGSGSSGLRGAGRVTSGGGPPSRMSLRTRSPTRSATGERRHPHRRGRDRRRYPDLDGTPAGSARSSACRCMSAHAPSARSACRSRGRAILDAAELEFLEHPGRHLRPGARADQRSAEAAAEQAAKLVFLADASTELASSLDYQATLARWPGWPSPPSPTGARSTSSRTASCTGSPSRTSTRRRSSSPTSWRSATHRPRCPERGVEGHAHRPQRADRGDHRRDAGRRRDGRGAPARSPATSTCAAPSPCRWSPGAGSSASSRGSRPSPSGCYTADDLALAEDLAERAAIAIDNAELHSETRRRPSGCSSAVLPEAMPDVTGWEVAGYYSPSGRTEVGGDFYDAVPLERRAAGALRRRRHGPRRAPRPRRWPRCGRRCGRTPPSTRPRDRAGQARPDVRAVPHRPARHPGLPGRRPGPGRARRGQRRPPAPGAAAGRPAHRAAAPGRGVPLGALPAGASR